MDQFISQPVTPVAGTMNADAMSRGEPGLPGRFVWNGREYSVDQVLRAWKTSSRGLCGEMYLRRHWYEVRTTAGLRMTLYCERQARNRKKPMRRWWIYSIAQAAEPAEPPAVDARLKRLPPAPQMGPPDAPSTAAS